MCVGETPASIKESTAQYVGSAKVKAIYGAKSDMGRRTKYVDRDFWYVEIITTRWACDFRDGVFCRHPEGSGDCEKKSCPVNVLSVDNTVD